MLSGNVIVYNTVKTVEIYVITI